MVNSENIKNDFTILRDKGNFHYLDSGATALTPDCVVEEMTNYYYKYPGTIHRGAYSISYIATEKFNESREVVRKFISAKLNSEIIFTKGTTSSLNLIAQALEKFVNSGDEIVVTDEEHHSNFIPWQELAKRKNAKLIIVRLGDEAEKEIKDAITEKTKVIAIANVTNVTGRMIDMHEIANVKGSAYLVVDGAQAVPHLEVNVSKSEIDFFVFSGHKMLGPTGVGVLYGRESVLETLDPFEFGGAMVKTVTDECSLYKDAPERFEGGTPAIAEVIGLARAVQYIESIGISSFHEHELSLKKYFLDLVGGIEEIIVYGKEFDSGVVAFNLEGIHSHDVATFLDNEGVCVRAGHHCNQLTMSKLGIDSSLRATFYIYNDASDVEKLVKFLKSTIKFFS